MKKSQMFLWVFVFLCASLFPQDAKNIIKPATNFSSLFFDSEESFNFRTVENAILERSEKSQYEKRVFEKNSKLKSAQKYCADFNYWDKNVIKPATSFSWDKQYQSYYAFKNIAISDYYELEDALPMQINNDEEEDYLILLTPKALLCPLDDDFDFAMNKFYRRCLVEVISDGSKYVVGKKYNTLISNAAGLGTGYDGIEKYGDGILIKHAKPNGNIYWEINMYFKYEAGTLCLYRIDGIDTNGSAFEREFENINAENICISDFCEQRERMIFVVL